MSVASAINLNPAVLGGGGGGSQSLSQVLQVGNSAGAYSIDMNTKNISNASNISATNFIGALTGNATTATTANIATNLAGGSGGTIPVQSGAGVTEFIPNGTLGQVLTAQGGVLEPVWTTPSGGSGVQVLLNNQTGMFNLTGTPLNNFFEDFATYTVPNCPSGLLQIFIWWNYLGAGNPSFGTYSGLVPSVYSDQTTQDGGYFAPTYIQGGADSENFSTNFFYNNQALTTTLTITLSQQLDGAVAGGGLGVEILNVIVLKVA
jgi:hypothetical protein